MPPRRPPVIKYVAHTATYSLMLDVDGVCRRVVLTKRKAKPSSVDASKAEKCLGAQYVASLDPVKPAELVALPRAGAPLLLAKVAKDGRITLVKTGALSRFDTLDEDTSEPSLQSVDVDLSEILREESVDAYTDGADRTARHDRKAVEARLRAALVGVGGKAGQGSGRLPEVIDEDDDEPPTRQQRVPASPWSSRPVPSAPKSSSPKSSKGGPSKRRGS